MAFESWIDLQIREARERGEFDHLEGRGKPLDLPPPDSDDGTWWIRRKLEREGLSYLPETLQARRDLQDALAEIGRARSERTVREVVARINLRIREVNRKPADGPPSRLMPLDVEEVVARWRSERA